MREKQTTLNTNRAVWQIAIARWFSQAWVELVIGVLILSSVVLTLADFTISISQGPNATGLVELRTASSCLSAVFIIELVLRFLSVGSWTRFRKEYWIDILAVLPSFVPNLGPVRLMRIIRLLRILRLFGMISRLSSNFPYILKRGAVEYCTVTGLLIFTIVMGTGALVYFEDNHSAYDAFWFSVYTLLTGEPFGMEPESVGGRVVAVLVMFVGLTIFAMLTGTVSAFMVERLRQKGRIVDWEQLSNHIVICGWSSKAEIILKEYRASESSAATPVVIIADWENDPPNLGQHGNHVFFLQEDFTRVPILEQAGIHRAKTCILLSDMSQSRSEQDADARTILAALTVEKLNPAVYTCAELNSADYGSHLEMGRVNDYVVTGDHSARLLAQTAMHRGFMGVFSELMTQERGNQFYRLPIPESWIGRDFEKMLLDIRNRHKAILIGVHSQNDVITINPLEYKFMGGDEIVVIAEKQPNLDENLGAES